MSPGRPLAVSPQSHTCAKTRPKSSRSNRVYTDVLRVETTRPSLGNTARRDCDAVLTNAIFVDVYTESGTVETIGVALGGREWRNGEILRQPRMCQRSSPADVGNHGGDMSCGRASDARFAGFARNIHAHAEPIAQASGLRQRADPAQLDRLQAHAAGGFALVVASDVLE